MTHRVHGSAVVRDNIRLSEAKLARVMTDMTVEQWLLLLDSKVFFFLQLCRLDRLLAVPGITTVAERADLHTRGSVPVWSRSDLR